MSITEKGYPIFGTPLEQAVQQIEEVRKTADRVALMADHHVGYSMPIGGVAAYRNKVSPSGVGFDIACGNKAIRLAGIDLEQVIFNINNIMDEIFDTISFGVGRKNSETVEHELFDDDPAWDIPEVAELKELAQKQLGTVGSGNHYVDVFLDDRNQIWVGVHFGSRGFGHRIATHFLKAAGGKDGMFVEPALLDADSDLGQQYIAAMNLAGRYAYAGRDWVTQKVASIIGGDIVEEVHNHHNFAWREEIDGEQYWVVRKGATPNWPDQRGFVGGSMGDNSVIIEGLDTTDNALALHSAMHGAGRVMSRTQAAGKTKWKKGKKIRVSEGQISRKMMMEWLDNRGIVLRGAGTDESPHAYKRLNDVIDAHRSTLNVVRVLKPLGVAMAPENEFDPYKD